MIAFAETSLAPDGVGHSVLTAECLPSTNDYAKTASFDPADCGTIILADHQTAGRGQYGRTWVSRPGASVLMSVVLFPPPILCRPVVLTAWAAVAVGRVVRELAGVTPRIKWPNDLLADGRKLSGILIEQVQTPGRPARVVAGIGLNVGQTPDELAAAGLTEAVSVSGIAGRQVDRDAVLPTLVAELRGGYRRLQAGDTASLEVEFRAMTELVGRQASVTLWDGTTRTGPVSDIGFDRVIVGGVAVAPESVRAIVAV